MKQQGNELNVEKKLYVERLVNNVRQLQPITAATELAVGDKVVSRLTIRLDRPMDFIQLKDQRAACFEPIGTLSGYRWNNGFGYYVDIKELQPISSSMDWAKVFMFLNIAIVSVVPECMKPDWQPFRVHMHPNMFLTPLR